MSRGKETKFLTELKHSFNEAGCQAIKLGDTPPAAGLRFTTTKEFDMVVNVKGKFVSIEGKFLNSFRAFGIREMREHQIENLDRTLATDGQAFVFLNIRFAGDKEKGIKRTNRMIIFEWARLRKVWAEEGSIKKDKLESLRHENGFKKRFDLTRFIEYVEKW